MHQAGISEIEWFRIFSGFILGEFRRVATQRPKDLIAVGFLL